MIDRINTIIEDLTNPEKSLGSVFLKVQVLAHQLRNDKLKDWVNNESNGYNDRLSVPSYRVIPTIVKGNLLQGNMSYTDIHLSVYGIEDKYKINLDEIRLRNPVAVLDDMVGKDDKFSVPVPVSLYSAISENYGPYHTSVISARQVITLSAIKGVIGSIKSNLLQFMLDIADEIGEGNKIDIINKKDTIDELFEKNLGSGNTYNINTGSNSVQNVALGDNTNTNVAHGSNNVQSINNNDLDKLKDFIELLNRELNNSDINRDDLEDIKTQISAIETQLKRDKPNHSILKGAFEIIKGLVIGIGSNMIPELIFKKMNGIVI